MLNDYVDPGQTFVTCPNQDVVYGLGFFSLDEEPVVIQVPDFGDRFWVYALYDARTEQFAEIGKPYGSKPGFYLLVGPNWEGEKPAGVNAVVRCSTELANGIPRVFQDDTPEDKKAIDSRCHGLGVRPDQEEIWSCDVEHNLVHVHELKSGEYKQTATIEMPASRSDPNSRRTSLSASDSTSGTPPATSTT